ncbi:MAG: tRNA (adenosine(37)-N6)-dimethylallyltransferase MiaA [Candidatus Coproplasma sp.]
MGKLLIICGATATGKSALAAECAKRLDSEVVSADSQLVYRGLNIGTAKPNENEMLGVKHHLIDVADPRSNFSVSDYRNAALPIIDGLLSNGKIPVICGGTGFYINSILYKLNYGGTQGNADVRKKYEKILSEEGKEKLFEILQATDPETAEKLHVNDVKRVIRALEIFELSGKKKSEQLDELISRYDYVAVSIDYPREELYARINSRVDKMFECGLVEEVKSLIADGVDENCQSMQAIGYKEVLQCMNNGDNESTMRDIIKLNTRHYAKRQITFFKKLKGLINLSPDQATVERVLGLLQ